MRLPGGSEVHVDALEDDERAALRRELHEGGGYHLGQRGVPTVGEGPEGLVVHPNAYLGPIAELGECGELECDTCRMSQPHVRPRFVKFAASQCRQWMQRREVADGVSNPRPCVCSLGSGYMLLEWELLEALMRSVADPVSVTPRAIHFVDPLYGSETSHKAILAFAAWYPDVSVIAHASIADYDAVCEADFHAAPDICLMLDCLDLEFRFQSEVLPFLRQRLVWGGCFLRLTPALNIGGAAGDAWAWDESTCDITSQARVVFSREAPSAAEGVGREGRRVTLDALLSADRASWEGGVDAIVESGDAS